MPHSNGPSLMPSKLSLTPAGKLKTWRETHETNTSVFSLISGSAPEQRKRTPGRCLQTLRNQQKISHKELPTNWKTLTGDQNPRLNE